MTRESKHDLRARGHVCGACAHSERCRWLLGPSFGPESTECDWKPSRFAPASKGATGGER